MGAADVQGSWVAIQIERDLHHQDRYTVYERAPEAKPAARLARATQGIARVPGASPVIARWKSPVKGALAKPGRARPAPSDSEPWVGTLGRRRFGEEMRRQPDPWRDLPPYRHLDPRINVLAPRQLIVQQQAVPDRILKARSRAASFFGRIAVESGNPALVPVVAVAVPVRIRSESDLSGVAANFGFAPYSVASSRPQSHFSDVPAVHTPSASEMVRARAWSEPGTPTSEFRVDYSSAQYPDPVGRRTPDRRRPDSIDSRRRPDSIGSRRRPESIDGHSPDPSSRTTVDGRQKCLFPSSMYADPRPPAPRNVILGVGQPVVSHSVDGPDAGDGHRHVSFSTSVVRRDL